MGDRVTASLHFWLRLSLALLTLRGLYSIGTWIAARRNMTGGTASADTGLAGRMIKPTIIAAFWFSLGCSAMILYLTRNNFERINLDVREVYAAGNAKMQERGSGDIVYVNPCPESPTKFLPGMHVKEIRYAQMAGCKLIKYFDYDAEPDGTIHLGEIADAR
jgi:hypothetical protein